MMIDGWEFRREGGAWMAYNMGLAATAYWCNQALIVNAPEGSVLIPASVMDTLCMLVGCDCDPFVPAGEIHHEPACRLAEFQ
jgi:hypothetical protein